MKSIQFERQHHNFNDLTKYLNGSDRSNKNNYLNNIQLQWKKNKNKKLPMKSIQFESKHHNFNEPWNDLSPTCLHDAGFQLFTADLQHWQNTHSNNIGHLSQKKCFFFFPFKLTPSPSHTKRSLFWQAKKRRRMKIFLIFSLSLT